MISLFQKMDVQETWVRSNSGIGQDPVNPAANHQPADQGQNWGLIEDWGPFGVMQGHFGSWRDILGHEGSSLKGHFGSWKAILCHRRPFWCSFGPFCGPRGPLKRAQGHPARVVQHDIISWNIPNLPLSSSSDHCKDKTISLTGRQCGCSLALFVRKL